MKTNPKLPPPARVGADDVKALPEPRVMYAWANSHEKDFFTVFAHGDTFPRGQSTCYALIPLTTGSTLRSKHPTKAQLRAIQLMMSQTPAQIDQLRALTLEEADNPEHMFEMLMDCFGLLPTPTGRRKGKKL